MLATKMPCEVTLDRMCVMVNGELKGLARKTVASAKLLVTPVLSKTVKLAVRTSVVLRPGSVELMRICERAGSSDATAVDPWKPLMPSSVS